MLTDAGDPYLIHLSDIHISSEDDPILSRVSEMVSAIQAAALSATHLLVVVSGDIAFSGKQAQYELATNFFSELVDSLQEAFGHTPHLVVVPGNHDLHFEHEAQGLRRFLLEQQRTSTDEPPPEVVEHCCKVMREFEEFRAAVETLKPVEFTRLWRRYEYAIGNKRISINAINNAWAAEKRLEPGALAFPVETHSDIAAAKADLRLTILHCPAHWLSQGIYRQFRKLVNDSADLVLTGHEHQIDAGTQTDIDGNQTSFVDGAALQDHGGANSEFSVLRLSFEQAKAYGTSFHYENGRYSAGGKREFSLSLPQGNRTGFRFSPDWASRLSDMGAGLKHQAKSKVELLDLFVYPDVDDLEGIDESASVFSSREFLNLKEDKRAILIKGDQGIGKSALLRAFASSLIERGKVPVLISGAELKQSSARELVRSISGAVAFQYGEGVKEAILQLPRDAKVLLLDNLDRYGFPDRYFNDVIEVLRESFGWVIATTDTLFDFRAAVYGETYEVLHDFDSYGIKPFGVRARRELARKWYQLDRPDSREAEERIKRNMSEAEKILSSVVGRGLVPAFPIYMLVLLQGTEAGRQGELENSALGTYYQYLLVQSLLDHTGQDQINAVFNYCAHFAWYLKQSAKQHVGERELREFHSAFERFFDLEISFKDRQELLLKSRIWMEVSGEVGFRYPYSYYFFLGSYISSKLEKDQEVHALVRSAAEALHVRENANILLFVAHHSQGSLVMDLVESSLGRLFSDASPLELGKDIEELNRAVEEIPKLVFDESAADQRRADLIDQEMEVAVKLDEVSDGGESQIAAGALKMVADLNALFKGIEILGAALKGNADGIEAAEKQRLLRAIFDGGLRGLRSLFEKLTSDPDYLMSEILEVVDKKKPETSLDKQRIASQAIFFYLSSLGYIFFRRIGTAVGSRTLRPALARYVQEHPTVANKLVNLSCSLETPGPLPLPAVRELNDQLRSQSFPASILRQLALARVYLYYTEAMERQQLCDELEIEMRTQRAIDYQTKDSKKVKRG